MRPYGGFYGLVITALLTNIPSTATAAEWCAQYRAGGSNCGFSTFAQCQAAVSGVGGFCSQSGEQSARPTERARQRVAAPPIQKNKALAQEPIRPAAAVMPAPKAITGPPVPTTATLNSGAFADARKSILDGQYEAGLASMRALDPDHHTEVASYVGLALRKLGRIEEARSWYDKALAADPKHLQTLAFYGVLRVEQGDLGGARLDLAKIKLICGNTSCNEYVGLAGVIAAKVP